MTLHRHTQTKSIHVYSYIIVLRLPKMKIVTVIIYTVKREKNQV